MEHFVVNNVYSAKGEVDPAVGISIAKIGGDENFGLYCARLAPLRKVGAHFHRAGIETYQIIEGVGVINTGIPIPD